MLKVLHLRMDLRLLMSRRMGRQFVGTALQALRGSLHPIHGHQLPCRILRTALNANHAVATRVQHDVIDVRYARLPSLGCQRRRRVVHLDGIPESPGWKVSDTIPRFLKQGMIRVRPF